LHDCLQRARKDFEGDEGDSIGFDSVEQFDELVDSELQKALRSHDIASTPGFTQAWSQFESDSLVPTRVRLSDSVMRRFVVQGLSGLAQAAQNDNASQWTRITELVGESQKESREHVEQVAAEVTAASTRQLEELEGRTNALSSTTEDAMDASAKLADRMAAVEATSTEQVTFV
jgi:hypothetical protein